MMTIPHWPQMPSRGRVGPRAAGGRGAGAHAFAPRAARGPGRHRGVLGRSAVSLKISSSGRSRIPTGSACGCRVGRRRPIRVFASGFPGSSCLRVWSGPARRSQCGSRGLPGVGVLTPSIRGASTCPTSPSPALTRPRCVGLTGLALRSRGGGSDPTARCRLAVSSVTAGGDAGVADRKSTRLNSSHTSKSRMTSSA